MICLLCLTFLTGQQAFSVRESGLCSAMKTDQLCAGRNSVKDRNGGVMSVCQIFLALHKIPQAFQIVW